MAFVSTLKRTVWPWFTLMRVAKPWIEAAPAPLTSHWLWGVPGFEFSQTIGLATGGSQGAATAVSTRMANAGRTRAASRRARTACEAAALLLGMSPLHVICCVTVTPPRRQGPATNLPPWIADQATYYWDPLLNPGTGRATPAPRIEPAWLQFGLWRRLGGGRKPLTQGV